MDEIQTQIQRFTEKGSAKVNCVCYLKTSNILRSAHIYAFTALFFKLQPLQKSRQQVGVYCLAPFQGEYYRGRIEKIETDKTKAGVGNTIVINSFFLSHLNSG